MPYQPNAAQYLEPICFEVARTLSLAPLAIEGDWTAALPVLRSNRLMLRELVTTDALSLLSMLSTEEVAKFISPPPTTPVGFE